MKQFVTILLVLCFAYGGAYGQKQGGKKKSKTENNPVAASTMPLGAFSMSLNVKDLATSKAFYENLGFTVKGGSMEQKYLIMKNGNALVGLFQGMFEGNILTFNPGWDEAGKEINPFKDVRDIQKSIKDKGMKLFMEADEATKGPAFLMIEDPDGNMILVDQHR